MALTQEELQSVVSAVLSAIRTNSLTIDQLTSATDISDTDNIEIGGGKKVSFAVLKSKIAGMTESQFQTFSQTISAQTTLLTPVRCTDEADLAAKAATAPVGQQFYIPEDD